MTQAYKILEWDFAVDKFLQILPDERIKYEYEELVIYYC